jgi:hypothetical protein
MRIDIHKILDCSKNLMEGEQANRSPGTSQTFQKARGSNKKHNVTGAPFSKSTYFAQPLEGPRPERTTT